MPKKSGQRKGGRTTPKGTRPGRAQTANPWDDDEYDDEPGFLEELEDALAHDHPLFFLATISRFLAVLDDRNDDVGQPAGGPSGAEARATLIGALVAIAQPETSAALEAIAAMSSDRDERVRLRREVAFRGHDLPLWLLGLDRVDVRRALHVTHPLGGIETIALGVRFATGQELSIIATVDHDEDLVLREALAGPAPIDEVEVAMREDVSDEEIVAELDLADARARLTGAIERWTADEAEGDVWPASRPLVEWVLSRMPEGGADYDRPDWDAEQVDDLKSRFFASPLGAGMAGAEAESLLGWVLAVAIGDSGRDPLRWPRESVLGLAMHWLTATDRPSTEFAPVADVLGPFIEFSHGDLGIPPVLTDAVLATLDQMRQAIERGGREIRSMDDPLGEGADD